MHLIMFIILIDDTGVYLLVCSIFLVDFFFLVLTMGFNLSLSLSLDWPKAGQQHWNHADKSQDTTFWFDGMFNLDVALLLS